MKALTWHGKSDVRCETVPDPKIEHPRDAIIKVTACAICGSDLHIFDGVIPSMKSGDIVGHESMGEVVEVGAENKTLKPGDRVVVPFTISWASAFFVGAATTRDARGATRIMKRRRPSGATLPPDCTAIPTCSAAIRADRLNIYACLMRMSDP